MKLYKLLNKLARLVSHRARKIHRLGEAFDASEKRIWHIITKQYLKG